MTPKALFVDYPAPGERRDYPRPNLEQTSQAFQVPSPFLILLVLFSGFPRTVSHSVMSPQNSERMSKEIARMPRPKEPTSVSHSHCHSEETMARQVCQVWN